VKGIQVLQLKSQFLFKRGTSQNCKNGVGLFKNLLFKNNVARKAQIYMKAS
jgi:hypothetical protein